MAFEVSLLVPGGPAPLSPQKGSVLFQVPAVLVSPREFPGVETALVRQSAALCFATQLRRLSFGLRGAVRRGLVCELCEASSRVL